MIDDILSDFAKLLNAEVNEAETRLKLIDRILFDVLGWTHDDVSVEERVSEDGKTTFADYILRTGMTAIVIEAKKISTDQVNAPNVRRIQLSKKFIETDIGDVICQARDYARKLSIPFAVATDGNYWVVFPATRTDQVPFHSSSAVIFPSIRSAIQDDFAEFYDLLSRASVIGGSLERELLGRIENQIDERRLNRFFTTPFSKLSRHSLFPLIENAITTAFSGDIVNRDTDLLEKCYVRTPERIRFDSRIEMHILRRHNVINKASKRPLKGKDKNALTGMIQDAAYRAKPVAVLVLGPVGVGKTTFLEYTREIAAKDFFLPSPDKSYPQWFQIDFRGFSNGQNPLDFIHAALRQQINIDPFLSDYERCIKHAYKEDIDALFRGPMFLISKNQAERDAKITELLVKEYEHINVYNEKILKYAAENCSIFLVIDNIDQFEDIAAQSEIFSTSMALSHRLGINLICSLREETYVLHRNTSTFDAFDFDPISIDSPDVKAVLSKRFFVAKQMLSGKPGRFMAENGADIHLKDMSIIIDLVQASVLGSEIGNLIEILATSDIRLALRMTREFLQSGYTASGKALTIFQNTGTYVLPQHEALRAIMVGNQQVYQEKFSVIGNPFDARCDRTEVQLLRLFILAALVQYAGSATFQGLAGEEIRRVIREVGYGDDVTLRVLQDLCRLRFIYTLSHSSASFEASFVPSRLGGLILKNLVGNLMFIENVMIDTFIADQEVWEKLKGLTHEIYGERDLVKKLKIRKNRAEIFFTNMKDRYAPLQIESQRRGLPKEWCSTPLGSIERQFRENLLRAERSAERNYGAD